MANGWSIIIGLVVIVLASVAAWFFSPKGETQTYVLLTPTRRLAEADGFQFHLFISQERDSLDIMTWR
ncbi:MAG: hypothetical protein M1818_006257 [Claussenomyces sp. TS43310]|nr:MAG: hypothetical protein M1818_006257 [Claussenomyces sp. TS43310]